MQQNTEFGCDAGPGLLLQAALAQYAFEKDVALNQANPGDAGGQAMRDFTFERCFPTRNEAVIYPVIRSEQGTVVSFTQILDRAQLDFHFPSLGDGRIRPIERTIGLRGSAPEGEERHRSGSGETSHIDHWAGWNTQIAAGSPERARTATNSRSSSGTNSDVRAPDTVGTRARRR